MEINNLDDLLYMYPGEAVTMFTVQQIYLIHGFNIPEDRQNLRIEWSEYFREWYISLLLDGYDDQMIASISYISANDEGELRFRMTDEREHNRYKFFNISLKFIKITEVTA